MRRPGRPDALQRARIELLRAHIAFHLTRNAMVPGMLLDAAKTLAPLDAALVRETYLHALDAAIITRGLGDGRGVLAGAEAARAAPSPPGPSGPGDLLLDALVTKYTQGSRLECPRFASRWRPSASTIHPLGRRATSTPAAGCGSPVGRR